MRRQLRDALATIAALAAPLSSKAAQPPAIASISPHGGRAGTVVTVLVEGTDLDERAELVAPFAARPVLVAGDPALVATPTRIAFRIELGVAEAPGPRPLRVRTAHGISNPVLFCVGILPETTETEPNDDPGGSPLTALPAVINGAAGETDRDCFRFQVRAGERLVFEADARRLGSSLDPTLRLYAPGGRELALAEDTDGLDVDARIDHTFRDAGEYCIAIHDATYSQRKSGFYRLRAGDFEYAGAVFPLGGRAGTDLIVAFEGGSLKAPALVRTRLPILGFERSITVGLPPAIDSGGAWPFELRAGDLPEAFEPAGAAPLVLSPPVTANARLDRAGEQDTFLLDAGPGSAWTVTLEAQSLGSWLDGVVRVVAPGGAEIAAADDDGSSADCRLDFRVPEGVERVAINVSDLLGRGGKAFGYRLTVEPNAGDFALKLASPHLAVPAMGTALVEVECARRGYKGAVRLDVQPALAGLRIDGGDIPPETDKGYITVTQDGPAALPAELAVVGSAADTTLRRIGRGHVFLADEHGTPATPLGFSTVSVVKTPALPIRIQAAPAVAELEAGGSTAVPIQVWRGDGASGAIEVSGAVLPAGVTCEGVTIAVGAITGSIVLKAGAGARAGEGVAVLRAELRSGPEGGAAAAAHAPAFRVRVRGAP